MGPGGIGQMIGKRVGDTIVKATKQRSVGKGDSSKSDSDSKSSGGGGGGLGSILGMLGSKGGGGASAGGGANPMGSEASEATFHKGGRVRKDMTAKLKQGELVLTKQQQGRLSKMLAHKRGRKQG